MKSNPTARPVASGSSLSYTQKISLAAGSLSALYLLPTGAQAGIVHVNSSPVSLAFNVVAGTSVNWDVDGVNGPDFQLWKNHSYTYGFINMASRTAGGSFMNGSGWVGPFASATAAQALQKSFFVGPTLAAYAWGSSGGRYRTMMHASGGSYYLASHSGFGTQFGFQPGDNYAGFRFLSGADTLYGWALINFDLTPGSAGITIKEWAYNDTADTPIHIADTTSVPEPSTPALTLLGLGAAGLRAWRARKQARAEEALAA